MLSRKSINHLLFSFVAFSFAGVLMLGQIVSPSNAEEPKTIYLPLLTSNYPLPPTVFGVQANNFTDPALIQLAVDAKVSWIRITTFDWSKIEPNPPVNGVHTYDWSSVPEESLKNITANNMYALAVVKNSPFWALQDTNPETRAVCGPIAESYLNDFAQFLRAAVE